MNKTEKKARIKKLVTDFRKSVAMTERECAHLEHKIDWFAFELELSIKKKS